MRPMVGRMPTSMLAFDGLMIDPPVSEPTLPAQKFAAVPMPELDPPVCSTGRPSPGSGRGSGRGSYGLKRESADRVVVAGHRVRIAGDPVGQLGESGLGDDDRAGIAVRFFVSVASYGGMKPAKTSAPPVVGMLVVWMLSLSATGMPCSGPRTLPCARSRSSASASSSAFGLTPAPRSGGPRRSRCAIRYCSTSCRDVTCLLAIAACICGIVASTTVKRRCCPCTPSASTETISANTKETFFMRVF